MGILGLTSFVDENPHLLTDCKLCNTKIVIDGNNLYHFLYYYFNINPQFGGDYDLFSAGARSYFKKLISCNIEPIVVFDGAYHSDDRKLKTSLKRANDRIRLAGLISKGERAKILPILVYESFRNVLDELSVKHVTCDFEADSQLTVLANELKCPVVSNDSDFFVYDVKAGFILIDYMNLHVYSETNSDDNNKVNYLNVQIFYLDTLLDFFPNFNRELIPLFASILGNDYIPREEFDVFFAKANLPKGSSRQLFSVPKRHSKFISLLLWLENQDSLEGAISSVLHYIHKDRRGNVEKLIMKSVSEYTDTKTLLLDYVLKDRTDSAKVSEIKTTSGHLLPTWFIDQMRIGQIPAMCLNAVVSKRVILLTQVESIEDPSAYLCSQRLRHIIYGLLHTMDKSESKLPAEMPLDIVEYDRIQSNLKKNICSQISEFSAGIKLPLLHEIPDISLDGRLSFLLQCLSVTPEFYLTLQEHINDDLVLAVLVVCYWIENASPLISDIHVKCILSCFLYLMMVRHTETATEESDSIVTCSLGHGMLVKDVAVACSSLGKFCKPAKITKNESKIIHAFAQFQTCLQSAVYLNQLLLLPLLNPLPSKLFSGTYLYNIFKELKNRKYPDLYLEELLGRSSSVLIYFKKLIEIVLQNVSSGERLLPSNPGTKNTKKKLKKEKRSVDSVVTGNSCDEDNVENTMNTDTLSNKFSVLMSEED